MIDPIISTLSQYIANEIAKQPEKEIAENEPLITSGLVDSFHLVDLALFIEDTFGVQIDDTELNAETFDTLEQLVSIIKQRLP